ncbi:hypothetical protein [Bacteroides sp.]|uniref:hypothetical protein n=1 Tax=Bacteroides sp. TaxID=29523 RepID=UPI0026354864|nr:hypothetical protein [Bacteroides sp.]MDD3040410.1 hypothetical protein [Bacteroides sp.]
MGKLEVEITNIYATVVDEWYGVGIEFNFTSPIEMVPSKNDSPNFARSIIRTIVNSPEYERYFKTEHRVWVEEYEDGPETEVVIPKFQESHFDHWQFTSKGGFVGASTRM